MFQQKLAADSRQQYSNVIFGLMKTNLENPKHGYCAKRPNLSYWREVFSKSARFGRYKHFLKLGSTRFHVTLFFNRYAK